VVRRGVQPYARVVNTGFSIPTPMVDNPGRTAVRPYDAAFQTDFNSPADLRKHHYYCVGMRGHAGMNTVVSTTTRRQLEALHASHPAWGLLLSLWEQVFQEETRGTWSAISVTTDFYRLPSTPVLSGSTIRLSPLLVSNWLRRLLSQITRDYDQGFALNAELANRLDPTGLLEAAITQDDQLISLLASQAGVDPAPLDALAQIVAAPVLRAAAHALAGSVPNDWDEGFCPVCGAWATLVEQRILERSRRLRCGRCGRDWRGVDHRCLFCKTVDFNRLAFPNSANGARLVETCEVCNHYVKVIDVLQPLTANELTLNDLSSVALDFAAVERGFARPNRPAVMFSLTIETTAS
jgi:FdhE protein